MNERCEILMLGLTLIWRIESTVKGGAEKKLKIKQIYRFPKTPQERLKS